MKRKGLAILGGLLCATALTFTACGSTEDTTEPASSDEATVSTAVESDPFSGEAHNDPAAIASEAAEETEFVLGDQLQPPKKGDLIATMETTQGTIKIRLFPQQAPKTVENFTTLAEEGDYNDSPFHRIIDGFMIQTGTTAENQSIYGGDFEDEFSPALINIRGAVSMANTGQPGTNSTQFFINQGTAEEFPGFDYLQTGYDQYVEYGDLFTQTYGAWLDFSKIDDTYKTLYEENGGSPTLDGAYSTTGTGHTVFGQVYEGMDVVDKIAAAETDASDAPADQSQYEIKSITISTYE